MKQGLNHDERNWMASLADEATVEMMTKVAGMFAAFYNGLRANGLSEAAAVVLTQAYITAAVTSAMQRTTQGGAS